MFESLGLKGKIFFILLLSLTMILFLSVNSSFAKEKKNITIVLFHTEQPSEKSFKEVVGEAYDVNWTITSPNRSKEKLEEIMQAIDPATTDLVYTYGTTVGQFGRRILVPKGIPVVSCLPWDPVGAGIIDSWENSGAKITASSINVPSEAQLNTLKEVINFKRLGVVYNPNESNGNISLEEAERLEGKLGFTIIPITFKGPEDIGKMKDELVKNNADAAYLTACSSIIVEPKDLAEALIELKMPAIAALGKNAKEGALLGLTADYGKVGATAGRLAIRILRGEDPAKMGGAKQEKFELTVNLKSANRMGIIIPVKLLKMASEIIKD
ncbi:MAG: ABC transporter substrate-binding protein [Candidatus Omnitrophota bacterium]